MIDREQALAVMGFNPRQEVTQRILNDRYLDLRMQAFSTSGQEVRLAEYAQAYETLDLKERDAYQATDNLNRLATRFEQIIDRSVLGMTASIFAFLTPTVKREDTIRGWLDATDNLLSNATQTDVDIFMNRLLKFGKYPEEAFVILKLLQHTDISNETFYLDQNLTTLISIADKLMDSDEVVIDDITKLDNLGNRLEKCGIESDRESGVYFACALLMSQNSALKQPYTQQELDRFAARVLLAVDVPLNHSKRFFDDNRVHGNMLSDTAHQDQARVLEAVGPQDSGHPLALPMPNLNSSESSIVTYTGVGLVALAAAAFAARAMSNLRQ